MKPFNETYRSLAYLTAAKLLGVALLVMPSGCVTDPSMWRPDDHIRVSRACRVVCHKSGVKRYDSMDGSCECRDNK